MPNRRGLGRGLDALIPTEITESGGFDPITKVQAHGDQVLQLDLGQITPNPHQPRQQFDPTSLKELGASIKTHGIVQPLVVSKSGRAYQLIAGERRWRAAKLVGLKTVPAIVRSLDEQAKLEVALIENVQRSALNPIETAVAYKKLIDQFNLKLDDVAKRVGKDFSTISNTMRLLGLPPEAMRALVDGQITEGHARAILAPTEPEKRQEMLKLIIQRGLTVRQAEHLARGFKAPAANRQSAVERLATTTPGTERLAKRLKRTVAIKRRAQGGELVIGYSSDSDLEQLLQSLLG